MLPDFFLFLLLSVTVVGPGSYRQVSLVQDEETGTAPSEPQVSRTPQAIMEEAKRQFSQKDMESCIQTLAPLVKEKDTKAMILTADALYALNTEEALLKAQELFFQVIYEQARTPYTDHCYFRIAKIYLEQNNPYEAKLYFKQTTRKFPASPYVPDALLDLFHIAELEGNLKDLKSWAEKIVRLEDHDSIKAQVRYVSYLYPAGRVLDPALLRDLYQNNRTHIIRFPTLGMEYGDRLVALGVREVAKQVYLDVLNFHPEFTGKMTAMLKIADFEKNERQFNAALFLYKILVEQKDYPEASGRAMIQVADMMSQADIEAFEVNDKKWTYSDLLTAIRFSALPPGERAPFVYRQALLQAVSDPPSKALLTLRQLTDEYREGPYSSLYRDTYKQLLHHTLSNFYRDHRYWDMDEVYQKHRYFLEHSIEMQYPHMMAKAFIEMGLTAPARDIFESLWREKETLVGFELGFEEPFVDYFLLLNDLRLDDFLKTRLPKYESQYGRTGRFYDRFLVAQTGFETRTLEPSEVVKQAKDRPVFLKTALDAKRLQYLTLAAQQAEDWVYAQELFQKALNWTELESLNPFLFRAAKVFDADFHFRIGNYFAAGEKYVNLRDDPSLSGSERVWADLQLARLHEMNGLRKESIELFGQVALNIVPGSEGYSLFAKQKLEALAFEVEVSRYPQGVVFGED